MTEKRAFLTCYESIIYRTEARIKTIAGFPVQINEREGLRAVQGRTDPFRVVLQGDMFRQEGHEDREPGIIVT